jgi:hypothetical protein
VYKCYIFIIALYRQAVNRGLWGRNLMVKIKTSLSGGEEADIIEVLILLKYKGEEQWNRGKSW